MIIGAAEVHTVSDAKKAVTALISKGCKSVILTLGSQGAVYASLTAKDPLHVPAPKVQALDTTVLKLLFHWLLLCLNVIFFRELVILLSVPSLTIWHTSPLCRWKRFWSGRVKLQPFLSKKEAHSKVSQPEMSLVLSFLLKKRVLKENQRHFKLTKKFIMGTKLTPSVEKRCTDLFP